MMKKAIPLSLVLAGALSLSGCGSGNEPMSILGDPNLVPQLVLPVSGAVTAIPYNSSSSSTEGFGLTVNLAQNVIAPADGVVSDVDTGLDSGLVAVTIYHNAHFSTRIRRLQNAAVNVGAYVKGGESLIGTSVTNPTSMLLSFYYNKQVVCPYSYLTPEARQAINLLFGGTAPCAN